MVSLGGLSAVFPGYQKARESGSQSDLREIALQDLQLDQQGSVALGKTFQAMMPGAQPMPGMQGGPPPGMAGGGPPMAPGGAGPPPQPPMQPGQPSVAMQPMGPMRSGEPMGPPMAPGRQNFPASGGGMLQGGNQRLSQALQGAQPQPQMPPQGGMPPPQPGPPPGQGGPPPGLPPPQGQFDLNTAAAAIAKANPGIRPEILVHALAKAMPYLNAQAQLEVKNALLDLRARGQDVQMRGQDIGADVKTRGQDITARGQDIRAATSGAAVNARFELQKMVNDSRERAAKDRGASGQIMTDEQQKKVAEYVAETGDFTMLQGLGRVGKDRAMIEGRLMDLGMNPKELAIKKAEFGGTQQAERTFGIVESRLRQANNAAKVLEPPLRNAIKDLQRFDVPPIDRVTALANREIAGNPQEVKFAIALQSFLNQYANVMARGYQTPQGAREHAYDLLKYYWTKDQLNQGIDQLNIELGAEMKAMDLTKQEFRTTRGVAPDKQTSPPPTTKGTGKYEGFEIVQ